MVLVLAPLRVSQPDRKVTVVPLVGETVIQFPLKELSAMLFNMIS